MMLLCLFLALLGETCQGQPTAIGTSGIVQDAGIIRAEIGKNVTMHCSCQTDVTHMSWYQQSLGGKLQLISTRMKQITHAKMSPAFEKRFRVSADHGDCSNHLVIADLRASDSATYFCAGLEFNTLDFGQGAFLHVRSSLSNTQRPVRQRPALEQLRPGDSWNLSCAVYSESQCAGKQSLYWITHGAARAVITPPSAGQCTTEPPHKRNCTFTLEKHSASSADAGTYYCALASCGEVVFGDGTRVEIVDAASEAYPVLLCCLSVAFVLSVNALLIVAVKAYKLQRKLCSVCKGTVSRSAAISQDGDSVCYVPLSVKGNDQPRHQGNNACETACVYARVKSGKK